ncbi:sugar phosphate isomerase/epimerase family protein, partial [Streptomyces sp. Act-28]
MRFAFSTLGVPGTAVGDVVRLAGEAGYQGVELRAHPEEPVHPGLLAHARREVVREFAAAGVDVLCVAGYARVAAEGDDDDVYEELHRLIHLAADLGAPFVRVFPGGGEQPRDRADAVAAGGGGGGGGAPAGSMRCVVSVTAATVRGRPRCGRRAGEGCCGVRPEYYG